MSESSPSLAERTMTKAAPPVTSPERANGNGRDFTPLSTSPKGEQIDRLVQDAVNDSEKEIAAAKKRAGKPTGAESPPQPPQASRPMPQEAPQQLPPGVTPEAFARLEGELANKSKTMEQAQAELEQMVEKAIGTPPEEKKPSPINKPIAAEKKATTPPPKVSTAPPTTSTESKFPALQKIKNMFGKMWDTMTSFLKGITSWITK